MDPKNFDIVDIGLIKWSSILFALFVVSLLPTFSNWVINTHWLWFLAGCLLLAIKPTISFFRK